MAIWHGYTIRVSRFLICKEIRCLGSRFGAMLDQLTDRCAFLGLLMTLCHLYPRAMFCLQLVAIIDIASHWLHLHAADLTGLQSHKQSSNPILNYYYTSK